MAESVHPRFRLLEQLLLDLPHAAKLEVKFIETAMELGVVIAGFFQLEKYPLPALFELPALLR